MLTPWCGQGVLLTLLVILAVVWAICCRRRCQRRTEELSVAEALRWVQLAILSPITVKVFKLFVGRKVSAAKLKDLPPSYSKLDLTNLGISVQDYLNPPPTYLDLATDSLQYLDLEQGHNRLAKLSFCNEDGSPPRLTRLSVAR